MASRIEIELTSAGEQVWTWRAAGARQPKGVVDAGLLYPGAKVGDVVRAEADFELDGITVTAVLAPRAPRQEPERLEIIGPPREHPPVTSSLVPPHERPARERPRRDRDDRSRRDSERGRAPRPDGRGARPERAERGDRRERAPGHERAPRPPRQERAPRPERAAAPGATPPRPRPKRLQPKRVHRDEVLASLAPEQRPVAEQVLRGGLPAVRQAVEDQNAAARAAGGPEIKPDALLAMAEELLPRLKAAEWLDRAEAAAASVDDIGLRDLRAIVAGADASARDEKTRALASTLRDALQRRSDEQKASWLKEITDSLDEGRVVRALRTSSRPPEPGTTFPSELASRLTDAAGAAMAADVAPDRWAAVLEAVVTSPVRRTVRPVALPAEPGEPLLAAARQAAPRVPALGALLGIARPAVGAAGRAVPPPPPVRRATPRADAPAPGVEPAADPAADSDGGARSAGAVHEH
jgi:hypothetical protein